MEKKIANKDEIIKKLAEIQAKLKVPKGQKNKFGDYPYRSCADILEAVKPLLGNCILTLTDEIKNIGNRFYVEATVNLSNGSDIISVNALAREAEIKKGMDQAQITGSASSYARKYALSGLFAIDDSKDDDTRDSEDSETIEQEAISNDDLINKLPESLRMTIRELIETGQSDSKSMLAQLRFYKGNSVAMSKWIEHEFDFVIRGDGRLIPVKKDTAKVNKKAAEQLELK